MLLISLSNDTLFRSISTLSAIRRYAFVTIKTEVGKAIFCKWFIYGLSERHYRILGCNMVFDRN